MASSLLQLAFTCSWLPASLLFLGCNARDPHLQPASEHASPSATPAAAPPAATPALGCNSDADCGEGRLCEGQGCGEQAGHCVDQDRICTTDHRAYCGCDGQVFHASGSCPKRRYAHLGQCQPPAASGSPCTAGNQCESGACVGAGLEGCHDPQAAGRCAETAPMCTRDLRAYCGCDGATFQASGSCPNRSYRHKGPC